MTVVNIDHVVEEVICQIRDTKDSRHLKRVTETARLRGHDMSQPLNIKKELLQALAEVCNESTRHHVHGMWQQFKTTGKLEIIPFLVENLALLGEGFRFLFPEKKETEAATAFLQQIYYVHSLNSDGDVAPVSKSLAKESFGVYRKTGDLQHLLLSLAVLAANRGNFRDLLPREPNNKKAIGRLFEIAVRKLQERNLVAEQRPLFKDKAINLVGLMKKER